MVSMLTLANQWEISMNKIKAGLESAAPESQEFIELCADLTEAEASYESLIRDLEKQVVKITPEQLFVVEEWSGLCLRFGMF